MKKVNNYISSVERTKRFLKAVVRDTNYCAFFSIICFYWEMSGKLAPDAANPMYVACAFVIGIGFGKNCIKYYG